MSRNEMASLFDRLKKGMKESIAHSRGKLMLKTSSSLTLGDEPTSTAPKITRKGRPVSKKKATGA